MAEFAKQERALQHEETKAECLMPIAGLLLAFGSTVSKGVLNGAYQQMQAVEFKDETLSPFGCKCWEKNCNQWWVKGHVGESSRVLLKWMQNCPCCGNRLVTK